MGESPSHSTRMGEKHNGADVGRLSDHRKVLGQRHSQRKRAEQDVKYRAKKTPKLHDLSRTQTKTPSVLKEKSTESAVKGKSVSKSG